MKFGKVHVILAMVFFLLFVFVPTAFADKSAVTIEAPGEVVPGTTITVKLNVTHHGNNFIHHTNWLYVKINGKEIKRWEYGWSSLPKSENFTVSFQYKVDEPIEITAEANCNLHGSHGPAKVMVKLKK
jgi:desulfoferrodoxin (superoxide reductase-like protein)